MLTIVKIFICSTSGISKIENSSPTETDNKSESSITKRIHTANTAPKEATPSKNYIYISSLGTSEI